MTGNARALRVLAITSRPRSMHGYAAQLCTASDRPAASRLASVRNTTTGSGVEADPYHLGYQHVATHQRKPALPLYLSPRRP
jgi:hypothetical protein